VNPPRTSFIVENDELVLLHVVDEAKITDLYYEDVMAGKNLLRQELERQVGYPRPF
jgi:hypothetical protein